MKVALSLYSTLYRVVFQALPTYLVKKDVEEILLGFPQLNLAQFHAALSYYYEHQTEIEADMESDNLSALLERFNLEINSDGIMSPK
ncbi:MAG: hypothetical protein AAF298_26405 [Cyanobacteria bacterium P01_A01_bin.40]